jgi:hypothetical protein
MSAAHHNSYAPGFPPSSARVEPLAEAGGHLAPGAASAHAPGVLSSKKFVQPGRFTPQEIERISAMRRAGAKMEQIAAATGRTIKALENAVRRGTIPRMRQYQWNAETMALLLDMRANGATTDEIAAHFGISKQTVWERVRIAEGRALSRRKQHEARLKPAAAKPSTQAKERRCLCGCNRMFASTGPGNRIRAECLRLYDFRHTGAV